MIKEREANSWKSVPYAKSISGAQTYTKFPIVLRTTEQSIPTWNIKGNTTQSGTPTSSNPVDVNGVGERTENLCSGILANANIESNGSISGNQSAFDLGYAKIEQGVTYTCNGMVTAFYTSIPTVGAVSYNGQRYVSGTDSTTFTAPIDGYCAFRNAHDSNFMLNEGSTAKPFEPYGYKIPISNNSTTYNKYLGEEQTVRQIKKLVLTGDEDWRNSTSDNTKFFIFSISPDYLRSAAQITYICTHYIPYQQTTDALLVPNGRMSMSSVTAQRLYIADNNYTTVEDFKTYLQQQYAAGTPVTVWYVLANPKTAAVNEPLMKIGNYADTLSNATAIPTASGLNTIDVNTTLKPSEMSLTFDGYKLCKRQRYSRSQNLINKNNPIIYYGYYDNNVFRDYSTNGFVVIPVTSGKTYKITGINKQTQTARYCTTVSVPVNNGTCVRTGAFIVGSENTITINEGENYLSIFLCDDADYSFYGSVTAAITANIANADCHYTDWV